MKVTLVELFLLGACREQRRLFKKTFGYSAEITVENMSKAWDAGLDLHFYVYIMRFDGELFLSTKKNEFVESVYEDWREVRRNQKSWSR